MEQLFKAVDGKTFESKKLCTIYENALNRFHTITELPVKLFNGERWWKIEDLADIVFFETKRSRPLFSIIFYFFYIFSIIVRFFPSLSLGRVLPLC